MNMLPYDALDRLIEGSKKVADLCRENKVKQWEIIATQSYGHQLDIEAGKISLAAGGGDGGYGIRVVEDGKFGYAYLVDVKSAENAIQQALSIARISPSIKGFDLPSNQESKEVKGLFDKRILSVGPEDLLKQADSILDEVKSLDKRAVVTGGGLGVSATAGVLTSSEGIEHHGITTSHGIGVQVSIDENEQLTSSWQGESSKQLIDEIPNCVANSVEWAQKTRDPIKVDNGAEDLPVLMTSEGLGSLFSTVIPSAIRGERLSRMESFWSGKQGENVMAKDLSLIDNAIMEGGISSSSRDAEGVPTRRQIVVDSGKLVGSLWSTRDSAKLVAEGKIEHATSTGSASRRGHQSPPVTSCSNLELISSSKSSSMDELLQRMDSGYIVNSVMGAHTANPTSGDFSVTTSSILRVEDGEVIGAIKQAGLSGNMAKALSRDVFLGDDIRVSGGSMHIPDILLMQALRVNPI